MNKFAKTVNIRMQLTFSLFIRIQHNLNEFFYFYVNITVIKP